MKSYFAVLSDIKKFRQHTTTLIYKVIAILPDIHKAEPAYRDIDSAHNLIPLSPKSTSW